MNKLPAITALAVPLFLALAANSYSPSLVAGELNRDQDVVRVDAVDEAALNDLRDAVAEQMKIDREFALERALKNLDLLSSDEHVTKFSPLTSEAPDNPEVPECRWPSDRPKGVTEDEWSAVLESPVLDKGEYRCANYTLMDMDSDGKRDLLIDIDGGGTGIWRLFSALQNVGTRFVRVPNLMSNQEPNVTAGSEEPTFSYSTNGRGANQYGYWIRLQNRVFLAFLDGHYGEDKVYLLRPFVEATETPILSVHYRYSFHIPREQRIDIRNNDGRTTEKNILIDPTLGRTLESATQQAVGAYAIDSGGIDVPCPSPEGTSDEEKSEYDYFGTGHYTFEIVAAFSFWWKQQCHIAELVNWFGSYRAEKGLLATLHTRRPPEREEISYEIRAKRELTELKMSQGKFQFF